MLNRGKLLFVAGLLAFSGLASAAGYVQLQAPNRCASVAGTWKGQATVSKIGMTCKYNGTAKFKPAADVQAAPYKLDLTFDLREDSWYCPDHREVKNLDATCDDATGALVINDHHDYDVSGNLNEAGTTAKLSGTINVGGIWANFDGNVEKQ